MERHDGRKPRDKLDSWLSANHVWSDNLVREQASVANISGIIWDLWSYPGDNDGDDNSLACATCATGVVWLCSTTLESRQLFHTTKCFLLKKMIAGRAIYATRLWSFGKSGLWKNILRMFRPGRVTICKNYQLFDLLKAPCIKGVPGHRYLTENLVLKISF